MTSRIRALSPLVLCVCAIGVSAGAEPHTRAAPSAELRTPPELESRPRTPFEEAVMRELACTCGTCALEPIVSCRCEYASTLRAEVRAELDKLDLSTEDGRRSAAESVRKVLIARHGPKIVRRGVDEDGQFAEVVVGSALVLGALVIVLFRRLRRQDDSPRDGIDDEAGA